MSNLIKSVYFNVDKEKKVIDTNSRIKEMPIFHDQVSADSFEFVPGINVLNVEDIVQEHKNAYEEKSNKLLQEAKNEADRIIEEANNRADKICSDAYDEGYQLGMQKGLDEAREELDKGQLELQQRENELQQEFEAIVNDLEPQFAEIVGGLVESITGVLCENNDIMQYLIDRTIKNLPSSESYVLHINREDYSNVYFNKQDLMSSLREGVTFDIVEDENLVKNQCMVETATHMVDCSLDAQLENLKRELRIISMA